MGGRGAGGTGVEDRAHPWEAAPWTHLVLGHTQSKPRGGTSWRGTGRAEVSVPHLVELSPSMADNISSSDESSSDRPLREALLQSDTHNCRAPGTYIHLPRGRGVDEMTHPSGAPRCQREVPEPRAGWRSHRRVPGKAQQPEQKEESRPTGTAAAQLGQEEEEGQAEAKGGTPHGLPPSSTPPRHRVESRAAAEHALGTPASLLLSSGKAQAKPGRGTVLRVLEQARLE